jgi:hypothetical protein
MSLAKSPLNNFGSGDTKFRAIVTTAAAALVGTLVGGASVLGIVTAVTQPPAHEIRTDAQPAGSAAPPVQAATAPVQAATPLPQTAPAVVERQNVPAAKSVPPVEGPRTVWPDALSARSNPGAAPAAETPAPQQASPPANDRSALNQGEEHGAERDPSAANSGAVTVRESQPHQISPNSSPVKKRVVTSAPGAPGPSAERTFDQTPVGNAPMGKTPSGIRKSPSQLSRQQRLPVTADRSDDGQSAAVAAPQPQRRVIILPGPDQAANDDRGHWGGGLFDFFGQNHSDGDHWNQDHWNNDWHGSSDWHD